MSLHLSSLSFLVCTMRAMMPPGRLPVLIPGGTSCVTCLPHRHSGPFFPFMLPEMEATMKAGRWSPANYKPPPPLRQTPPGPGRGGLAAGGLYAPDEGLSLGRAHSLAYSITMIVTASQYPSLALSGFNVQGLRGKRPFVFPGLPPSLPGPIPAHRPPRPASVPSNPASGGHPGGHFHA